MRENQKVSLKLKRICIVMLFFLTCCDFSKGNPSCAAVLLTVLIRISLESFHPALLIVVEPLQPNFAHFNSYLSLINRMPDVANNNAVID